jgi:hypothetical protein
MNSNFFSSYTDRIKSRTRDEWFDYGIERVTDTRIWIQENGEKAAIVFLAVGIFLVLFFKLVLFLVALAAIAMAIVWFVAPQTHASVHSTGTESATDVEAREIVVEDLHQDDSTGRGPSSH